MAKLKSKGTTLKIGSTALAQVVSIKAPNRTVETIDVTELGDANRSFLAGINDNGEVSAVIHYDPDSTTHQTLQSLFVDQLDSGNALNLTPQSWVITFTDATPTTYTFNGVLTGLDIDNAEINGVLTATLTIKVSGAVVIA